MSPVTIETRERILCDIQICKQCLIWPNAYPKWQGSKIVSMIRKYHNHKLQTNPCNTRKSHTTIVRHQEDKLSKATNSLSFAKLEGTQSNEPQNIEQVQTPTMGVTSNNKVSKVAKIRNRYNQVPHLTQDTNGKVTNSQETPQTRAKRSALSQQVTTKHI